MEIGGEKMDYLAFCKKLYAATGVPTALFLDGHIQYSTMAELLEIEPEDSWTIYEPTRNPEFASINPNLEYGHVRVEGTGYDLYLGPVFTEPVTETLVQEYFEECKTPPGQREATAELLYAMPISSHPQFVRYLLFLHYCLNHKEADAADFYGEEEEKTASRSSRVLDTAVEDKENETYRNSYSFEQELYKRIRQGDVSRLKDFLERTQVFPSEGKTAHSPLRHAKNAFIGITAKTVISAAIPGGIDPDRAYQLSDLYMMECEQMQSIDEVHRLQYIMLMDFCHRCGIARLPEGVSEEVFRCMNYIQSHTNVPLGVEEVAEHIHRSSSYLMRRFKAELGLSVGEYITKCKLEEACDLLTYGDRSLAEISAYLGYSSQSYFQNVFKKQYGMTPMQYRKKNSRAT